MVDIIVNSSLLIVLILVFRKVLMGRVSKKIQYALWLVVVCRLLIPGNYFPFVPNVSLIFNTMIESSKAFAIGHGQNNQDSMEQIQGTQNQSNQNQSNQNLDNQNTGLGNLVVDGPFANVSGGANGTKEQGAGLSGKENRYDNSQQSPESSKNEIANSSGIIFDGRDDSYNAKSMQWYQIVWIVGVVLIATVIITSNLIFSIKLKNHRTYLETYRGLKVYKTSNVSSSCLYGIVSPQIYLTDECLQDDTMKEIILIHEYTHFKHLDHLWSLVRMLCVCIYWFNPLVWCAAWVSRCDGEMACDESVLWSVGSNRVTEYGQILIQMSAVSKSSYGEWVYISTGFGGSKRELKERIVELTRNHKRSAVVSIGLIVIALIIGVIAFGKGHITTLQVFENQITMLESYRTDIDKLGSELCYEGIELDSRDFYKQEISAKDREEFRRINTVASFVNELGFELEDFSAELYLKSQDGKYVECITFYGGKWYCITQNMQSGSIKMTTYDRLEINEAGDYKEYKLVSAKEEKVLFKLSYKNLSDYEIGNEELQHTTLYLSGYTGYLDENDEYKDREYFQNLDIDQDGVVDRVYRQQLDWEFCNIEVHFGDKSTLLVEKVYDNSIPKFLRLPSDTDDMLIAFRNYYPGAVGEVVHNDMKFFKKENDKYVETPLPFSEVSYADNLSNGVWNQYVNVNVKLVDANNRTVAYTCKEFPEFYEEITMTEEDYWAGDFALQFENGGGNIDCADSMVYFIQIPQDGSNTIICKAHVIYHCSDELTFVMKYIDDKWQVLDVGMSRGTGYETQSIKSFSIVNENNCKVSYVVDIEDDQYIGTDTLVDYEVPFRFKMYNIPTEFLRLVGDEGFEKYLNSYDENIVKKNYVATSVEEAVCVYSFIKWFDIPKETVKSALKDSMNTDIVPEEYKLTKYDIDFIYSGSVEEINYFYASDYSIVAGGYIYTPEWIISHSKEEILATGINSEMLIDKLEYYETLPLPEKVMKEFRRKLSDLCGEDSIKTK